MKIIHYISLVILVALITLIIKFSTNNNLIPWVLGAIILIFAIDFLVNKLIA